MRLAVIIPIFNERELLPRLIARLDATPPPLDAQGQLFTRHIFLIDDGSTDGTIDLLADFATRDDTTALFTDKNRGKGAALRRGFIAALELNCDIFIVQDADLEYDPKDHNKALAPLIDGRADAVIGTRFLGETHRVLYFWHSIVNRAITALSNMLSNLNLTDIECGTKAFSRPALAKLSPKLKEDRFGIEPEIIAKLAKIKLDSGNADSRAIRIYEVPISYAGRTYAEGKKITWRDGLEAVRCIIQYNLF